MYKVGTDAEVHEGAKRQQARRTPEHMTTNFDILRTQFYKIHAPKRKKNGKMADLESVIGKKKIWHMISPN